MSSALLTPPDVSATCAKFVTATPYASVVLGVTTGVERNRSVPAGSPASATTSLPALARLAALIPPGVASARRITVSVRGVALIETFVVAASVVAAPRKTAVSGVTSGPAIASSS
jgi:hypothetical protein